MEYSRDIQERPDEYMDVTPIGAFIANLFERIAWEETAFRELTEHFILSDISGPGSANMRIWPLDCLTEKTRNLVKHGVSEGHGRWKEWGYSL
jgi:hypothetical protein